MSELLRCPNGHEWQARSGESTGDGAIPWPCPVCGSVDRTLVSPPTLPFQVNLPASLEALRGQGRQTAPPKLGGYEILEELGRGGMGVVYKAHAKANGRVLALKVIRKERLQHPDMVQRFRREVLASDRLSHPNIVAVYEADQDGDLHYLALEYVPGVTLQRWVEAMGPMPVPQACEMIRQAALGLQHAADQALVHRDIKPSNLMILAQLHEPLPARPRLKILDMGVARLYQLRDVPEESLTTLTRDGVVIGTPDYIAPEQLENPHHADIRADLYSLGCTFYFLLAGTVPFPGGTLVQKLDRQRWQTPTSVDQLRADVPGPVAAVVRRLMAKHPDDRYQSPAELASALEQLNQTGVLPAQYQPEPLREVRQLRGHVGPVVAVAFAADENEGPPHFWSAGSDRTIRGWSEAGSETVCLGPVVQEVGCLAVVPGSTRLLTGQGVSLRVWDTEQGKEVLRLRGHHDALRAVAVSADGRIVLTGSEGRTARLWDLPAGREQFRLTGPRDGLSRVALSQDGRIAVATGRDGVLRLWDASSGRHLRNIAGPRGAVLALSINPEGTLAITGHFDTTVRVWDLNTSRELRRLRGHRQMVSAVAVAPGGRVVSGSHDHTVRVWDVESGCELWCCLGHTGPVTCVALDSTGHRLLSGSVDRTVRMWDLPP